MDFGLELDTNSRKTQYLAEIAAKYSPIKQYDQAKQIVQTLEDIPAESWEADVAITRIAVKLAQARQFSQALQITQKINNSSDQVLALIIIADEYIESGQSDEASKLLSKAVEKIVNS